MTSITARNRKAIADRNGTTIPEAPKATPKPEAQAKAPAAAKPATVPTVACGCGCGVQAKPGRLYLPGHDARHAGAVGRLLAEGKPEAQAALAALPPKLAEKATRFADNRKKEASKKAAAARLRAEMAAKLKAELAALDAE